MVLFWSLFNIHVPIHFHYTENSGWICLVKIVIFVLTTLNVV